VVRKKWTRSGTTGFRQDTHVRRQALSRPMTSRASRFPLPVSRRFGTSMFKGVRCSARLDQFQRSFSALPRPRSSRPGKIRWRNHLDGRSCYEVRSSVRLTNPYVGGFWFPGEPPRLGKSCRRISGTTSPRTSARRPFQGTPMHVVQADAGLQQELAGKALPSTKRQRDAVPRQSWLCRSTRNGKVKYGRQGPGSSWKSPSQAVVTDRVFERPRIPGSRSNQVYTQICVDYLR